MASRRQNTGAVKTKGAKSQQPLEQGDKQQQGASEDDVHQALIQGSSDLAPWLVPELERSLGLFDAGRLHHALLLSGRTGLGKSFLAMALARALLCDLNQGGGGGGSPTSAAQRPCGECKSCRLTAAGNHPDMRLLGPNKAGERGEIVVDTVRGLIEFLHLSAQLGGTKVAVIVPCDRLNRSAANSLLKTLEEPPQGVFLILATGRPGRLPATVRSRCTIHQLPSPRLDEAQLWLSGHHNLSSEKLRQALVLCGGMPFSAHNMLHQHGLDRLEALLQQLHRLSAGGDPIKEAQMWQDNPHVLAEMLTAVIAELLRRKHGGSMLGMLPAALSERLADATPLDSLHQVFEQITAHRRHLEQPLQGRLAAEAIFIDLSTALWGRAARSVL
ncbi:DNA polymerase III delta prime subunit [Halorhodospira halochloris]|uniref:DNA polymerase III subunit delta' n=1 Tax=Halorhodospira halochloris TaxID=1052 RepID=A0A120MZW6_HALHR|nr:AAA family ATPase [Halorhodospira halochloris]MBK1652079.1 hypothetical protein [Halorhodospira halochloris]BAU58001.1 DNA polymerase III delta prime subunit [Halorhodospira halochloris]